MATDIDVIIIGAGVAGLNAARTLMTHGVSFVVVEAGHRIGGRAYSEQLANGSWFDLGCSYLHEGEINPIVPLAHEMGIALGDGQRYDLEHWHLAAGDRLATPEKREGFRAFYASLDEAMAARIEDCPISDLIDWDSPFAPTYAAVMTGLNAADVTEQSVLDYLRSGFGLDYPVGGGLGRLIAQWGAVVPVTLNCAVDRLEWRRGQVTAHTQHGRVTAKRAIITVSTGILASSGLAFAPALPDMWINAIGGLPCGTLNKIGLGFAPGSFAPEDAGWHTNIESPIDPEADASCGFDINLDGPDQVIVFEGGSRGIYLERLGPQAMRDYALDAVTSRFGSAIESRLEGSITTAWHSEPLSLGSYAYATPGFMHARDQLRLPIEETLFFAGEATSKNHYGTCHGAYWEGARAADEVVRLERA